MTVQIDTPTLEKQLSNIFSRNETGNVIVSILSRAEYDYRSTFPIEIVTCLINHHKKLILFCKYLDGICRKEDGHRGGIEYEIKVYQTILRQNELTTVRYYGSSFIQSYNETVIVLEYLENSERLHETMEPEVFLSQAAKWIAGLHSQSITERFAFLHRYSKDYFNSWIYQIEAIQDLVRNSHPWLLKLINFFKRNIHFLTKVDQCLIHGEFYANNILVFNNGIYPIDWETTAIGPGEIDLASLIEGWSEDLATKMINAYKIERWGSTWAAPQSFDRTMIMSQLYLQFSQFSSGWLQCPNHLEVLYSIATKLSFHGKKEPKNRS